MRSIILILILSSAVSLFAGPGDLILSLDSAQSTARLRCEGQLKDTASFSLLFHTIGYTYGGTGSQFRLPDFRSQIPIGAGQRPGNSVYAIGTPQGEEFHTLSVAELAPHTHGAGSLAGAYLVATESKEIDSACPAGAYLPCNGTDSYSSEGGGALGAPVTITTGATGSTGSAQPIRIIPPVQPVYVFILTGI